MHVLRLLPDLMTLNTSFSPTALTLGNGTVHFPCRREGGRGDRVEEGRGGRKKGGREGEGGKREGGREGGGGKESGSACI